ncbi:MAG: hypothetical protein ACLQVY_03420 [Limisphaerales bacterium]
MRKREIIWLCALLLAAGIYARYFTGWFVKRQIAINASWRPNNRGGSGEPVLFFTLNGDFQLTSLKVIPLEEDDKFNPAERPVWNLVSESNSSPVRAFLYGQRIKGMKPALPDARPEPLEPGTAYRMLVSVGDLSGYTDFRTRE